MQFVLQLLRSFNELCELICSYEGACVGRVSVGVDASNRHIFLKH